MDRTLNPIDRIAILADQYHGIMGESLDLRIVKWLNLAGFNIDTQGFVAILDRVPKDALFHLAERLEKEMRSGVVTAKLQARKAPPPANDDDRTYDPVDESEIEPDVEFIDVDPDTQADILRQLQGDY